MKKIAVVISAFILLSACAKKLAYPEGHFDGKDVRIDLSGLQEKEPVFFTFRAEGKGINYFVVKVDGEVQSYFDACAKCYPRKLGYRLEGGRLVCKACEVHYDIEDLKEGIGSCYPIKLRGRVEGKTYLISGKEILAGRRFF